MRYLSLFIGVVCLVSGVTGRILPKTLPLKNAKTGEPAIFTNRALYTFIGLMFTLNALFLIFLPTRGN
jgi:hypothetical protein